MYDHHDISCGLETCAVVGEAGIYDELGDFQYVKCNVLGPGTPTDLFEEEFSGCLCREKCLENCPCITRFSRTYDNHGRVLESVVLSTSAKPIYECNRNCKCSVNCPNRVVQFGVRTELSVFRAGTKGLGLKVTEDIPKYTFICEYAGEILALTEAKRRAAVIDKTGAMNYILILREFVPHCGTIQTCVDPSSIGNVGRFINHSCAPNLIMLPVRVDNNVPKLCLFSVRDIKSGEELTFDYSGEFRPVSDATNRGTTAAVAAGDEVSCDVTSRKKPCFCGTSACRGFLPYDPSLYDIHG